MNNNDKDVSFEEFLREMTPSAFELFGVDQLSYIKPMRNAQNFELFSADGKLLAEFKTFDNAISASKEQFLKAVTVH